MDRKLQIRRFGEESQTSLQTPCLLPGEVSTEEYIKEMIRVDHAGEYGAVAIYTGQVAADSLFSIYKPSETFSSLLKMREQEIKHFSYFQKSISKFRVRPTALRYFWWLSGFSMGFLTRIFGKDYAMCCTDAVEDKIAGHYSDQLKQLKHYISAHQANSQEEIGLEEYKDLYKKVEEFRDEELEHQKIATDFTTKSSEGLLYKTMFSFIKIISSVSIKIAKKI